MNKPSLKWAAIPFLFSMLNFCLKAQTIKDAFFLAGSNKEELIKVLKHYDPIKDAEKHSAAAFLIKNMGVHESHAYNWYSNEGKKIYFSEFEYEDFSGALKAHRALKDSLKIRPRIKVEQDIMHITADLLIENIDLAFKAWKENPWCRSYDYETFCEYILPYRSIIEPLEPWREECQFLVQNASKNLEDKNDPVEVCTNILNELKDFSFRFSSSPIPAPLLGTQQLLFRREGSCPELANLAVLAARSMGVAATFDYTPHYAASSNRHFWNTVIDKEGKAIPFNGSSANDFKGTPYNYNANNKRMAKVIRNTYAIQSDALASKIDKENIPSGFLRSKHIIDVTKTYMPVASIKYAFKLVDSMDIAYLNVFNLKRWQTVHWAKKEAGIFKFDDMGLNIVYLPSYYHNGVAVYAPYPMLLDEQGVQKTLKPNFKTVFNCTLSMNNTTPKKYQDENNSTHIEADENYTLFYWDYGWKTLDDAKAGHNGVSFKHVPDNALFLLLPEQSDGFERIFTIAAGTGTITWY